MLTSVEAISARTDELKTEISMNGLIKTIKNNVPIGIALKFSLLRMIFYCNLYEGN
jgi:hypothetical protein